MPFPKTEIYFKNLFSSHLTSPYFQRGGGGGGGGGGRIINFILIIEVSIIFVCAFMYCKNLSFFHLILFHQRNYPYNGILTIRFHCNSFAAILRLDHSHLISYICKIKNQETGDSVHTKQYNSTQTHSFSRKIE